MAAVNKFVGLKSDMAPAGNAFTITPHDTNELAFVTRGLYLGVSGDVAMILANDTEPVTFTNLLAGVVHPFRVKLVRATGTDADLGIIGVY